MCPKTSVACWPNGANCHQCGPKCHREGKESVVVGTQNRMAQKINISSVSCMEIVCLKGMHFVLPVLATSGRVSTPPLSKIFSATRKGENLFASPKVVVTPKVRVTCSNPPHTNALPPAPLLPGLSVPPPACSAGSGSRPTSGPVAPRPPPSVRSARGDRGPTSKPPNHGGASDHRLRAIINVSSLPSAMGGGGWPFFLFCDLADWFSCSLNPTSPRGQNLPTQCGRSWEVLVSKSRDGQNPLVCFHSGPSGHSDRSPLG